MRHPEELSGQRTHSPQEDGAGTAATWPVPEPSDEARPTLEAPDGRWPAGESAGEARRPRYPVNGRRTDSWVLVCGGIAAAAAFAAAFLAAGGATGHPAPGSTVPAAVSQACPSAAP
jgi:hypothetical protein